MANQEADTSNQKKEPGILKAWILRFFVYVPILWAVMVLTHTFVQFPENRAEVFCKDSYRFIRFYYVTVLMPLSFSDPDWTFERSNNSLEYKYECDSTNGFNVVRLIPNIRNLNLE